VPNCPINVGSAPPAAAVAAGSGFAGFAAVGFAAGAGAGLGDSLAASLAPFGAAPWACAKDVTPHNAATATRNVSIRNTDNWFPHHCDWKMARGRIAPPGMDSREMLFWEGGYGLAHRSVSYSIRTLFK
jgi:hypothetical protein